MLERCIGDVERFRDLNWGRAPLHIRTDDCLPDIFGLDDVDELIASAARRPEARLVRNGNTVDPAEYTTTLRLGGRTVSDVIDPAKVADRLVSGDSVVLQSVHRTSRPVSRFASALEGELGHPVQVNAYLTPPGAVGLAPHVDEHDVIVRQLHGTKAWHVVGLGDIELGPGDGIYMPAGTRHHAAAQDQMSLHLTIGILAITYRAVVNRVLARAGGDLDRPLPVGWNHDPQVRLDDHLALALDEAQKVLADADPIAIARTERGRRRPRRDDDGRVSSVVRRADLDADTVVQLARTETPRLEALEDGFMRLHLSDRQLRLPDTTRPALEQLLLGRRVRVGELPGLDASSQCVVARRLVIEGMLRIVPETTR